MKRALSIWAFLTISLVGVIFECTAQVSYWDGTAEIWTQGGGTENNPYQISSAKNLAYLANSVNDGETYSGVYFRLTTDIDLQSLPWQPIGGAVNSYGYVFRFFKGVFEGGNHTVRHLSVPNGQKCGLFGAVGEATVQNLRVEGSVTANMTECCAALVAAVVHNTTDSLPTVFSNCHSDGEVVAHSNGWSIWSVAGGVVGLVTHCPKLVVLNCTNSANITAIYGDEQYAGGMVGGCAEEAALNIRNCHNVGDISATGSGDLGGIIGHIVLKNDLTDTSYIAECSNIGHIHKNNSGGDIGGIVGMTNVYSSSYGTIIFEKCFNTGMVDGSGAHGGGIIGRLGVGPHYNMYVRNCYNTGNVSLNYVAGIVAGSGNVSTNSIQYDNCYSTGLLTGSHRGGIVASGTGIINNCYYLNTCGGTYAGGTATADSVMRGNNFPSMLNTDSVVFILAPSPSVNHGYPIFGNSAPQVLTYEADSISHTSAHLHGYCSTTPDTAGFQFRTSDDSTYTTLYAIAGNLFSCPLQNLPSGTVFHYRAFTLTGGVPLYGQWVTFQTLACDSIGLTVTSSEPDICEGESATLTATVSTTLTNPLTFLWNTGETSASIQVGDSLPRIVTVSDDNGCTVSDTFALNVWPQYTTDFVISTEDSCYVWNDSTYCNSGDYTNVFQTIHGCDSTVTLHLSVSIAVAEFSDMEVFSLYPNPTTGKCMLVGQNIDIQGRATEIQLSELTGKVIRIVSPIDNPTLLDLSSLPSGIYIVKIIQNDRVIQVLKVCKW